MKRKMCLFMPVLFTLLSTSCSGLRDLSSQPVDDPPLSWKNPGPDLLVRSLPLL